MARGKLRIYLGAAPGVGKTYAMLSEAHRRVERGTDCVVALRRAPRPAAYRGDAARPGSRSRGATIAYRGSVFTEMDVDAVLAREPGRGAGRRARPHQRPRLPQRQALAGRRGAAGRRHRRDLDRQHPAPGVARRRRRVDHRRPAARDRSGRGGPPRRPDRAGRHVPAGAAPPHGPRQHLHSRTRSTRRCRTTSVPATSPRCANWRCCGSPTGSTSTSSSTAASTGSARSGGPASASSSASPAAPRAVRSSAAPPGSPPRAPAARSWPSTSPAATG